MEGYLQAQFQGFEREQVQWIWRMTTSYGIAILVHKQLAPVSRTRNWNIAELSSRVPRWSLQNYLDFLLLQIRVTWNDEVAHAHLWLEPVAMCNGRVSCLWPTATSVLTSGSVVMPVSQTKQLQRHRTAFSDSTLDCL